MLRREQLPRVHHPALIHVADRRDAGHAAEVAAQDGFAEKEMRAERVERQLLGVVAVDIADHVVDAADLFHVLPVQSVAGEVETVDDEQQLAEPEFEKKIAAYKPDSVVLIIYSQNYELIR